MKLLSIGLVSVSLSNMEMCLLSLSCRIVLLPYFQVGSGCPVLIFAADMAFPGMWLVCTVL